MLTKKVRSIRRRRRRRRRKGMPTPSRFDTVSIIYLSEIGLIFPLLNVMLICVCAFSFLLFPSCPYGWLIGQTSTSLSMNTSSPSMPKRQRRGDR